MLFLIVHNIQSSTRLINKNGMFIHMLSEVYICATVSMNLCHRKHWGTEQEFWPGCTDVSSGSVFSLWAGDHTANNIQRWFVKVPYSCYTQL